MDKNDLLLVMTICALLGKPTNPAAVKLQYEHALQVLELSEQGRK
ncbi:MAG TPA: hypothetical protein VGI45_24145 [Terracidiphilus sp.]|jgi:hypothetical protein